LALTVPTFAIKTSAENLSAWTQPKKKQGDLQGSFQIQLKNWTNSAQNPEISP
jgi:hypothetical protein